MLKKITKLKTILLMTILFNYAPESWATIDIGSEVTFLGFMGYRQEYALLLMSSIHGISTDEDAFLFTVNMTGNNIEYIDKVKFDKEVSEKIDNAFYNSDYRFFAEYFLSKLNKSKKHNYGSQFAPEKGVNKLPPVSIINFDRTKFKKSFARYKVNAAYDVMVFVDIIKNSSEYHVTLKMQYKGLITEGTTFDINSQYINESCEPNPSIYDNPPEIFYDNHMPINLDAYTNVNSEIIVAGSLAHNPLFCGTFFPVVAVHPGKKATSVNKIQSAKDLNALGYKAYKEKKLKEALGYFNKAIEADPKFALAHYNLACVLSLFRKMDKKDEIDAPLSKILYHLEQSIQLDPSRKKRFLEDADLKPIEKTIGFQKLAGISPSDDKNFPFFIQLITWYGSSGTKEYPFKTLKFNKTGDVILEMTSFQTDKKEKVTTESKGKYSILGRKVFLEFQGMEGKNTKYTGILSAEGVLDITDLDTFKDNYKDN